MLKIVKNSPRRFRATVQTIYKDDKIIGEMVVGDLSKTVVIKLQATHTIQTMVELLAQVHRIVPMNYKVCFEYGELSSETKYDPYTFYHG